jgi:hypothetical protein
MRGSGLHVIIEAVRNIFIQGSDIGDRQL